MNGITWAVAAGVGFGVYQSVLRRVTAQVDAYRTTLASLVVAVVVLTGVAWVTEDPGRLTDTSAIGLASFAAAGLVHFVAGWTFLGLSQQRIGASRTGVVIAATPLIGTLLAVIFLDEAVTVRILSGVVLVAAGVGLIAAEGTRGAVDRASWGNPLFGLGAAAAWGTSPLFIRRGLEELDVPILGVTVGMTVAAIIMAAVIGLGWRSTSGTSMRPVLGWMVLGGLLVGTAIVSQWEAFAAIEISVAIALMQLSTPVVVVTAPFVTGSRRERPTIWSVAGMLAVGGGSVLVVIGSGG